MKAITICQPYAHLIITPQSELPEGVEQKRVENRRWPTKYRGPLLIHAGKSKDWIDMDDSGMCDTECGINLSDMQFGAIIGKVDLIDCIPIDAVELRDLPTMHKYPWLPYHQHTEGPWCHIYANAMRCKPIPYRGQQGPFEIPDEIISWNFFVESPL